MRVISGQAGGIRLQAPAGSTVRPTTDRVKESVFASLEPLHGLVVADLFSGSGALGLEALSRGAAVVLFAEHDRRALHALRDNAARVQRAMGDDPRHIVIHPGDVARIPTALPDWAGRVDVVLADPPYRPRQSDYGGAALLGDGAFASWAGNALLVLEHAADTPLPWHPRGPWSLTRQKRFGGLTVSFARCAGPHGNYVSPPPDGSGLD